MNKKNKKDNSSFFAKYKLGLIGSIIFFIFAYIAIYICFRGKGFLYVGTDLEKKDWLSFLGAYLAFAGTVTVSLIATLQTKYFEEREKALASKARREALQPIFSINIESIDKQIAGTAEPFNPDNPSASPKHKNVSISFENISKYPIRNVIIFDKYNYQLLKPNEKFVLQVAYSDSPDVVKWEKLVIVLLESKYERTAKGIPKRFNINYEDIDGNVMYQTFELKNFGDTEYYSLESIEGM